MKNLYNIITKFIYDLQTLSEIVILSIEISSHEIEFTKIHQALQIYLSQLQNLQQLPLLVPQDKSSYLVIYFVPITRSYLMALLEVINR